MTKTVLFTIKTYSMQCTNANNSNHEPFKPRRNHSLIQVINTQKEQTKQRGISWQQSTAFITGGWLVVGGAGNV